MTTTAYDLFSRCHPLFVQGMRASIRERLEKVHGSSWWQRGVMPSLSGHQHENLSAYASKDPHPDQEMHLDTAHFGRIIRGNHVACFAEALPDIDEILRHLEHLRRLRDKWAHAHLVGLGIGEAGAAVDSMLALLVPLKRREALEIQKTREEATTTEQPPVNAVQPSEKAVTEDEEPMTTEQPLTRAIQSSENPVAEGEEATDSLSLWRELQSYLSVNLRVDQFTDPIRSKPGDRWASVTVSVTNVAPSGPLRPEVVFGNVRLKVQGASSSKDIQLGRLEPGQTSRGEVQMRYRELASAEFVVSGEIDQQRYFTISRPAGPPEEIVSPLLRDFAMRFSAIKVDEPLAQAIEASGALGEGVTLAEAARVRANLAEARSLIKSKVDSLNELFHDFYLNKQSRLGSHCVEVVLLLQDVAKKVGEIDSAIGETNASAIAEAVASLEQLQLAMLQVQRSTGQALHLGRA